MHEVQEHATQPVLIRVGDVLLLSFGRSPCNAFEGVAVGVNALNHCVKHNERRNIPATSKADVVHVGPLAQVSPLGLVVVDAFQWFPFDDQRGHAGTEVALLENAGNAIHGRAVVTEAALGIQHMDVRLRRVLHGELQPQTGQTGHVHSKRLEIVSHMHAVEAVPQARPHTQPRQNFILGGLAACHLRRHHLSQLPAPLLPRLFC